MSLPGKEYLGDSVYVEIENGMFKLTTENGLPYDPSNKIYMEPEVFEAFQEYAERAFAAAAAVNSAPERK